MGGSQSAACYLARSLAKQGHVVFFFSATSAPGNYDGVICLSRNQWGPAFHKSTDVDAMVCIAMAGNGVTIRRAMNQKTRLILWNQHAPDQPDVQALHQVSERQAYDGFAMVSHWQRALFYQAFGIDPARSMVLRNAIAPAFINQYSASASISLAKQWPPILAYTSTPFRGLDVLLDAFGQIRAAVPGTRLQVFSSMKVYQMNPADDQAQFGRLYQRCRETDGVDYIGPLAQPELARAMRPVAVLAYPNTFPETSCIAVMEAMASGCRVVTSDRGALPETSAGFARLVSVQQDRDAYIRDFVGQTVRVLSECQQRGDECEGLLRRQVDHVNTHCTWDVRAAEWVHWLQNLVPRDGSP
jgi:glycosyltransferase involved in cell wall biosynthesis